MVLEEYVRRCVRAKLPGGVKQIANALSNVRVASVENLLKFDYNGYNWSLTNYVTVKDIAFSGANGDAIWGFYWLATGHQLLGVTVRDCEIVSLGASTYEDMLGTAYSGALKLKPFGSIVLIKQP